MSKHDRLVWIDLEMTGLDPDHHVVVEVAALVTDADLNILGQGVDCQCPRPGQNNHWPAAR